MKPTDADIAILRAFVHRNFKRADLTRLHPELGDVGRNLERLYGQCYLNREVPSCNEGAVYALAPRGMRLLSRMDREAPMGEIAGPRQYDRMHAEVYTGERANVARPGALDFLKAPSMQGGSTVEWKRPTLIGAAPEPYYRALP